METKDLIDGNLADLKDDLVLDTQKKKTQKKKISVSPDILKNFDFSSITDDDGDDPLGEAVKANPMDFVLAKLNIVPNYKRNDYKISIGGKDAIFQRGKWLFVRYRFVEGAKESGYLSFASTGDARKKILANHPIIDVRILPDIAQEDIYSFRDSLAEKTGKKIPFAETEMEI